MMPLYLGMFVLALMAAAFVIWPLWHHRAGRGSSESSEAAQRLRTNVMVFREHMRDLDTALAEERIDVAQYSQLKLEQQRALLDDQTSLTAKTDGFRLAFGGKSLVASALIVVVVGALLYQQLGRSQDVYIEKLQIEKATLDYQDLLHNREPDPVRARKLMAEVEARLAREPDNLQYQFMLARQAMELGEYGKAVTAYQHTLSLDPEADIVMAELAQALFLRDHNQMSPEIAALAKQALATDPANTTALGLAGIEAFQHEDFRAAAEYWQKAVDVLGADAPGSRALQGGIARAKQELAERGEPLAEPAKVATATPQIHLQVSIADNVTAAPEQLVYVYARAWQGARMPLAITRIKVADLPATITLDESMAMSAMASLAQADKVEVVARISSDGSAIAKSGDWQASAGPLDMQALPEQTALVIRQKLDD